MESGRYIFTSDLHLGAETCAASAQDFISFLDNLPADTRALYLLGDIFDFWFERRRRPVGAEAWREADSLDEPNQSIDSGFAPVLKALRNAVSRSVEVYFLKGNHDWWTFGRLERLTGVKVLEPQPLCLQLAGKRFCIAHGDALGPMDFRARFTKALLKGRVSIFMARYLVPERLLYWLAALWSGASRHTNNLNPYVFGTDSPLYRFTCEYEREHPVDCFIFGHIHSAVSMEMPCGASLHLLDDWSAGPNWLEFDGKSITRVTSRPGSCCGQALLRLTKDLDRCSASQTCPSTDEPGVDDGALKAGAQTTISQSNTQTNPLHSEGGYFSQSTDNQ